MTLILRIRKPMPYVLHASSTGPMTTLADNRKSRPCDIVLVTASTDQLDIKLERRRVYTQAGPFCQWLRNETYLMGAGIQSIRYD